MVLGIYDARRDQSTFVEGPVTLDKLNEVLSQRGSFCYLEEAEEESLRKKLIELGYRVRVRVDLARARRTTATLSL